MIPWWWILYWALYGALTIALLSLKLCKIGSRKRGAVKMLTSCAFFAAGIIGAVKCCGSNLSVLLCVGLLFASIGDLLLVFRHIGKCFVWGVRSFCVSGVVFSIYSILIYGWNWWTLAPYAVYVVGNFFAQKYGLYSFGRNKLWLNIYAVTVGFCGCLGLALFCQGTADMARFLFGLGCFAYFVSDIFLGLFLYKFRNRFVDAANTLLYFPGLLLVAISLWF